MNEFHLLGKTLEFPDEVINYAKYYSEFVPLQKEADMQFDSMYEAYGSIENMINGLEDDCCKVIYACASVYISRMVDEGFYELNEDIFFQNYVSKIKSQMDIISVCDWVAGKYIEIENKRQEMEKYRERRKASRGQWHGGGFGIRGAITGAAMAGTANMISGLGHSVVNAIGNMETSATAHREGQKIYKSKETKQRIHNALRNDLYAVFRGYLALLQDKLGLQFKERRPEDASRVDTIISNISKRELNTEEAIDIVVEMFQTDPYNNKLYQYVLERFGDRNLELQKIAEKFAAELLLNSYKQESLRKIISNAEVKTIEDNEKLLDNLSKAVQRNGILKEQSEDYIEKVQNEIDKLKLEARTFQGVVYESEQEALEAKEIYELEQEKKENERQELMIWKGETDFANKESLQQLKSKLLERKFEIDDATECMREIEEHLSDIDKQERTVDGVVYESHESAQAALKDKESYEIFRDRLFEELEKMLEDRRFEGALLYLKQTEVSEVWMKKLTAEWNQKIKERFEKEINESRKYQKVVNQGGIGNTLLGGVLILVIGFALSFKFPIAIIIAIIIAVLGVWGNIMEAKENEKRKPVYDFIQQLITYGYEIEE